MVNKAAQNGVTVLVTGAGSGIGAATALAFAARGARVVAVDINQAAADETARRATAAGAPVARAYRGDVGDWESMAALAEQVTGELGTPDVLVNNAGVGMTGRLADLKIDDWRWIRSVNLDGVVHGCLAFGPAMLERGTGHVVNVSSGLAYTFRATEPAYCTTKAAVLALSRCLRADWGPRGIGVTAICPGVINTPIVTATRYLGDRNAAEVQAKVQKIFRRGHPPEKVAAAIIDAVEHSRSVVPVGWEAKLGWYARRFVPTAFEDRFARLGVV